jgi:mannosyltransferase
MNTINTEHLRLSKTTEWVKSNPVTVIFLIIIIASALLRFYNLGFQSLWYDEAQGINESHFSLKDMCNSSNQPPLYFLIERGWIAIFGNSEIAVRFPSAIFGIISVISIYFLGKNLVDNNVGLVSAFLLTTSRFAILYSQEARSYSLYMLLSVLSYLYFVNILKKPSLVNFILYLLTNILLGYTHIFGIFIIFSQIVIFAIYLRDNKKLFLKYLIIQLISIISFLPLIWLLGNRVAAVAGGALVWENKPTLYIIGTTLSQFSGFYPVYLPMVLIFAFLIILGVVLVFFKKVKKAKSKKSVGIIQSVMSDIKIKEQKAVIYLLIWMVLPIIISVAVSYIAGPMYEHRYLIGILPAYLLLVAIGITQIHSKVWITIVLLIILIVSSIGLQYYYTNPLKEQWREAVEYIEYHELKQDKIVLSTSYIEVPFDYYYQGVSQIYGPPNTSDLKKPQDFLKDCIDSKSRIWLFMDRSKDTTLLDCLILKYGKDKVSLVKQYTGGIGFILFDPAKNSKLQ